MSQPILSEALLEFLRDGISARIATRDARLMPECAVGWGARIDPTNGTLTVFVPNSQLGDTVGNLEDNAQIAVTLSRPSDYRTYQVKGTARAWHPAPDSETAALATYDRKFREELELEGQQGYCDMIVWWPALAIVIDVREVFLQTPGPGTGGRLRA